MFYWVSVLFELPIIFSHIAIRKVCICKLTAFVNVAFPCTHFTKTRALFIKFTTSGTSSNGR